MDTALRHIGNFISTGDEAAEIYLHALDEHLNATTSQRDIIQVLDTINFLLSKAKTRIYGLQLLDKVLPWVNHDLLEQKIQVWTSFILKACNQDELRKYGGIIYKSLINLAHVLRQYAELSKNFASNHLSKVYEVIAQSPAGYQNYALKCAETYLSIYPKPSGLNRETMKRFLQSFPDTFDDEVNHCAGRCLHYLQLTTVPGSKDRKSEQWKSYQHMLIESLSAMLDVAYSENNDRLNAKNCEGADMNILPLKLSTEPDVRAAQLFVRFHNLANYLKITLCEPNNLSTCKPIVPKRILNLITRGLVITCAALNQDATYSKIAFGVFLPKIQLDLLELTKTMIRIFHCHLRIFYKSFLDCLMHVLKSTSSTSKSLRTQVYNVIALWCQTLGEGSRCELYADELVPELLKDISPVKNELIPQVKTSTNRKKGNNLTGKFTKENLPKNALDKHTKDFYLAAMRCLQTILRSCACFLKPSTLTTIQMSVIKNCASFCVIKRNEAYNNWQIRLEMYKLLHTILITPNQRCPPPSQIVIYILCTAQSTERNVEIRLMCTKLLEDIEKILHPQKESLIIPIEARAIRNAFKKIGKETLLEQSHLAISTLRYGVDIQPTEDPYRNGEIETEKVEDDIFIVENNEEISEEVPTPKASYTTSPITNKKKTINIVHNECLEAPKSKKQKISQNDCPNPVKLDISDGTNMEIENLKPLTSIQKHPNNTNSEAVEMTKVNKEEQPIKDNFTQPKNIDNEISELEAFFVDELKKNC